MDTICQVFGMLLGTSTFHVSPLSKDLYILKDRVSQMQHPLAALPPTTMVQQLCLNHQSCPTAGLLDLINGKHCKNASIQQGWIFSPDVWADYNRQHRAYTKLLQEQGASTCDEMSELQFLQNCLHYRIYGETPDPDSFVNSVAPTPWSPQL